MGRPAAAVAAESVRTPLVFPPEMVSQTTHQISDHPGDSQDAGTLVRRHLLTVNVEDYFQVGAFQKFISTDNWYRFESRLQQNVEHVLSVLADHDTTATFFVLGWTAEKEPALIRRIADAGHEIASRGYLHQPLLTLTREQIRQDLMTSKSLLEDVAGRQVCGFRLSDGWLSKQTLWLLEDIAAAGYRYDSSLMPRQRDFAQELQWRRIRQVETPNGPITEVPLTTIETPAGWLPIAGGNYQRQVPDFLMSRLVDRVVKSHTDPFVMYFQVWELDEGQPELSVADQITKLRHYRNLGKYRRILPQYLKRYSFTSVENHAQLDGSPLAGLGEFTGPKRERGIQSSDDTLEPNARSLALRAGDSTSPQTPQAESGQVTTSRTAVTLVIPCFNEESSLSYLANTLSSVTEQLSSQWAPKILFVDDCSTDDTYPSLQKLFGSDPNVKIVRHESNRGVSAAILTGLREADTDIVASMDCDCSYDPHELNNMLPLLTDGVSMVTASPYHADGLVRNVPGWRLFLSRGLSAIYQRLLRQPLATWTSCFRIYRRCDVLRLTLHEDGFLGTAELAAQLVLNQRRIVEHPTTLEVRLFGLSKMKTLRAVLSHLKLLTRIIRQKKQTNT